MKKALITAMLGSALVGGQVNAVEFDGFLTAGFSMHDQKDITYLDGITEDVSFDNDSKFGLQISAEIARNMQGVAQVLASGSDENYDLDVEWAYMDYTLNKTVSIRGGKIKEPVFLISDYFEVGYAYPWIRPPQEVYTNNPINTIVGMAALFQGNAGNMSVSFQPYLGSNTDAVPGEEGLTFNAESFMGGSFQLSNSQFTMQMSYLTTDVSVSGSMVTAVNPTTGAITESALASQGTAKLTSFGLSWDVRNFIGYAEYVTRDIEADPITATNPAPMDALFPDQDAYYVTLGYRSGKFLPHVTFANSESDPVTGGSPGVNQDSITLGLRYELNDSAALKFEYQTVEPEVGETGLFSGGALTDDKANVISVAVDVIF